MSAPLKREEICDHHAILEAIRGIGAMEELVEYEPGHGFKFGVDLEVCVFGRNYGPGKKVGPYISMFTYPPGMEVIRQGDWDTNTFFIIVEGLAEVYVDGRSEPVAIYGKGRPFGENAVLAGIPRVTTVRSHHEAGLRVLEVQRPALRVLRKLRKFGAALDLTYRNNGRNVALHALSISDDIRKELSDLTEFKVMARGHILIREGSRIENLIILKDGWIKRTAVFQTNEASDFLGPGYCLGMEVFQQPEAQWVYKAVALSRTEILEIPVSELRGNPKLAHMLWQQLAPYSRVGTPFYPPEALTFSQTAKDAQNRILDKGLADATNLLLMDMDLCVRCGNCSLACHNVHGHSRLIRHGIHVLRSKAPSQPKKKQSLLAPAVCLHCKDPECLTGCPTGAIARFAGGQVDISPPLCIGCGDCATQCPYNAISLIPRKSSSKSSQPSQPETGYHPFIQFLRKGWELTTQAFPEKWNLSVRKPVFSLSPVRLFGVALEEIPSKLGLRYDSKPQPVIAEEDLVAIKCNLCSNTPLNPKDAVGKEVYLDHKYSCEENCPTGALMRVKPTDFFDEIAQITGKAFQRNGSTLFGASFGYQDRFRQHLHWFGILMTLLLCGSTMAGIVEYGLGTPLFGTSWLNFRWITGMIGLMGIAIVMLYPFRRQMWQHRVGSLRHWLLAHTYAGIIGGVVLLLHGGTCLGGALTTTLMVSFDFVILTGLWGILLYQLGPRLLTRIEGEPLLLEDLTRRREELYQEIANLVTTAHNRAQLYNREEEFTEIFFNVRDQVLVTTTSLSFLLRQYLYRETLEDMLNSMHWVFQRETNRLRDPEEQKILNRLIDAAVTARRIDALIYIHRALKLWLPPHVISTSCMLVLLAVHIIQVVYYIWR